MGVKYSKTVVSSQLCYKSKTVWKQHVSLKRKLQENSNSESVNNWKRDEINGWCRQTASGFSILTIPPELWELHKVLF